MNIQQIRKFRDLFATIANILQPLHKYKPCSDNSLSQFALRSFLGKVHQPCLGGAPRKTLDVKMRNVGAKCKCHTWYKAGYQTEADRYCLHVPTADQILVLARGLVHEAEVNADGAACDQHHGEYRVVRYAEVLHGFADFLNGGHVWRPVRQQVIRSALRCHLVTGRVLVRRLWRANVVARDVLLKKFRQRWRLSQANRFFLI